ncbi:MAG TPA: hypothetical protein VF137_05635 [Candidatus Dormibacteraeota bacterium]
MIKRLLAAACLALPLSMASPALAANPGSATIDGSAPVQWDFAPVGGLMGDTDTFKLTVKLPEPDARFYAPDLRQGSKHAAVLEIVDTWNNTSPDATLGIGVTDSKGNAVGGDTLAVTNDGSDVNVFMLQDPSSGTYTVTASNQIGTSTSDVASHAVATLKFIDLAAQHAGAGPAGGPRYDLYRVPLDLMPETTFESQAVGGRSFGEPSIGVDRRSDTVMYQAGLFTMQAKFDDSARPAAVTWKNVSDTPLTDSASEDAILYVDPATGRTFVSQLVLACSLGAVSDDDGASWIPVAKACQTPPAVDHETIGGGPFAAPLPPGVVYPDAMYYCSQNVAYSACALSVDGGLIYGAASPMWTAAECFGLHGHIKVAPDGTAYVPDKACGSPECDITTSTAGPNCHPGFAVSTNNGVSWTVHTIQDGHMRYFDTGDPSIGVGSNGTMYFGYGDRDGHPKIAVCTNQGADCGPSVDVGTAFHIVNTEMAEVVAGDDNRAAFAFLGSTTPGDDQQNSFVGTWHLYVATTYDAGRHWTTVDATPNAPVQRGCIEFNANTCPSTRGSDDQRNLLDFNDITIDSKGRVLVAYTDGCQPDLGPPAKRGSCLTDATRLSGLNPEIEGPAVARQSCGLTLLAKYDGSLPACAAVSRVSAASAAALPPTLSAPRPFPLGPLVILGLGALLVLGGAGLLWRRPRRS